MGAMALPKSYSIQNGKAANAIAKRIGVRFNGEDRPRDVIAYNVTEGWIKINTGEVFFGVVEPYWRV